MKLNITFNKLLDLVRQLTPAQKQKLRRQLNDDHTVKSKNTALRSLLLNGPLFTDEQIKKIENTRKSISEWRTK